MAKDKAKSAGKADTAGTTRRSTGNVMEPGDGYLENGHPNLSPSAGYVAAEPVQYADESDTQFEMRMKMWNSALNNAKVLEGNPDFDSQREEMEARHKDELAGLDLAEERAEEAAKNR